MTSLYEKLSEIVGKEHIFSSPADLESFYKRYMDSFLVQTPLKPKFIVQVENRDQIEQIIKLGNEQGFTVVPVSSTVSDGTGAEAPLSDNSIIIDLSRMNKILNVDRKNRVCMIEAGVTFGQLLPVVKNAGLRLLSPLLPSCGKSVVTSALEREPPILPRYHWDASDPLLCTEVVFGTGDLFRTGAAAGPGTIEEQRASGQAQVNPLGPTQFDPFRLIQGAQGSIGIVTWITLKCELLSDIRKLLYVQSENLKEIITFLYTLLKRRFGDELFIVNNLNLSALVRQSNPDIEALFKNFPYWTLLIGLGGRGSFGQEKIDFLEAEISDIAKEQKVELISELKDISNTDLLNLFDTCTDNPWRTRYLGASQNIFFLTTLDKCHSFLEIVKKQAHALGFPETQLGVYIQPLVQGCNCHCEFNIMFDPSNESSKKNARELFINASIELMEHGAFFSRPYGFWADEMYKRVSPVVVDSLQKVKAIFDPKHILHRGVLCFKEGGA
ncbi:MAG: FAD-binding oxidoreductase [Candidatus Helarchaeota archaeon]